MGLFDFFKSKPVSKDEYVPPFLKVSTKPISNEATPVKEWQQKPSPTCPSCKQQIKAIPKRTGTCIHFKQKYFICKDPENGKYIFTNSEGKNAMEKKKQRLQDLECSKYNTASFKEAQEVEGVKKIWMFIPGLDNFNEKHKSYEAMGPVNMDYEYSPGLKYPGDPHCKNPEETEGCICSIGYQVD